MTTAEIKNHLHEEIENCDSRLLKMIYALLKEYKGERPGESVRLEQHNRETEEAVQRMDASEFTPREQGGELSKTGTNGQTKK